MDSTQLWLFHLTLLLFCISHTVYSKGSTIYKEILYNSIFFSILIPICEGFNQTWITTKHPLFLVYLNERNYLEGVSHVPNRFQFHVINSH